MGTCGYGYGWAAWARAHGSRHGLSGGRPGRGAEAVCAVHLPHHGSRMIFLFYFNEDDDLSTDGPRPCALEAHVPKVPISPKAKAKQQGASTRAENGISILTIYLRMCQSKVPVGVLRAR